MTLAELRELAEKSSWDWETCHGNLDPAVIAQLVAVVEAADELAFRFMPGTLAGVGAGDRYSTARAKLTELMEKA